MPQLFDPLRLGELTLPNRILMAPLTRSRATDDGVPTPIMVEYYRQRASAGLIFSEATPVTPMGIGYANTPGIWNDAQVEGWKKITAAVHGEGGRIFLQLWHVGRISDPVFLNGELPVAPSAIQPAGHVSLLRPQRDYVKPRALQAEEIPGVVEAFRKGAENAQRAGFDGVLIHGANGYLLDQFLQDKSNHRIDGYGGSVANRARLMLEVADAAIGVWGSGRVGVHLAPRCDAHDMGDSNPVETFTYLADQLGQRDIAFISAREAYNGTEIGPRIKTAFHGIYLANESFTRETAQAALDAGTADAIMFGKLFIANPDLPLRFKEHAALNTPKPESFYGGGAEGYIDYPAL